MQTHRNKEVTSSLYPSNSDKNKETISMCAVKRENVLTDEMCHPASSPRKRSLIDSRHEITPPHMKRIKQDGGEPCFWEDKESKTSLQSIVSEVAHSFENNPDIYESIPTFLVNKGSCLDNVNRTFSTAKDTVLFQHKDRERKYSPQIAEDVNEVAAERESYKESMPSVDKGKREISVLSIAGQVEAETTKPILRTIKSSNSGKSEGFAYDHNFFPKLVGVHSISSPLSSSTETGFQMKTQFPPPVLETPAREHQNINAEEAADVYEVKACASSRPNESPGDLISQSSPNNQSEKECDLLFTFKQDNGKSDLFLVIKDEVFSVKRFDHNGESYLIHTDNKGKTSILAKAPKEEKSGSQNGGSKREATEQSVSNNPTRFTNVSTIVSELSRQTSLQRTLSHQPALPSISNPTQQSSHDRIADINAQETPSATCGQHQLAYDNTRMLRQLLSNAELQRVEPSRSRPQLPAGQQRFLSQARADRHQVITNDSLQNSTAVAISAPFQASTVLNTSSNILCNQHLIANQDSAAINQSIHNTTNESSQQQNTNTSVQGPCSDYNAVSSGKHRYHRDDIIEVDNHGKPTFASLSSRSASKTNENRIEQRKELMRYITHQLASSGNKVPSASNSSELINLVTKGREVGRQPYRENVTKGTGSSSGRYQEMAGLRQRQDNGASLPPRHAEGHSANSRSASGVGTNIGVCDVGQRYHPRQRVGQNSAELHSQPQSEVPYLHVNHLQGSLQSNSETEGNSKVLQIIESWKRRQLPFSSSNTFRQLRELLTRVDGSANSSQNTYPLIREKILNKPSQVAHPSSVASDTPVISQISYGVINRSTDGENVTPKKSATALVIDQRHSIYVDATDSVMDERRTPVNTGQQFSNNGNTVSDRSYQSEKVATSSESEKVATSFPVSTDSTVGSLLQEAGRPVNSNTTSVQRPNFSSTLPENPAAFSDQRFYNFEILPRKTAPKVNKRCVANNTLNPVPIIPTQIIRLPRERNFVTSLVSGQQNYFNKTTVQSNPKIVNPSEVTKPSEVPSYGVSDVAGPSEAAKLCRFVNSCEAATANGKTRTVDVVEIIDSPPTQESLPSPPTESEKNEDTYMTASGQRNCANGAASSSTTHDTKLCHAEKSETDDVVEITNSPSKGDSIDHVTVNKDNLNSQSEEDEQTRINALRAELIRKIQNTNDRIAQENIDWKKKYLNRLKIALTKKLAKLPGVIDVTVIDDD